MVSSPKFTRRRRDAALVVLALFLLTAPVWIGQFSLDASVSTYERTEVGVSDGTIEYVEPIRSPEARVPISERLGCTSNQNPDDDRLCAYEHDLAQSNRSVLAAWATNARPAIDPLRAEYRFLALSDGIYEQTRRTNDTAEYVPELDREMYPVYLDLELVPAQAALDDLSVDTTHGSVPDVARRAAESGDATARGEADVPSQPIRLDDGTYYRVYQSDVSDPPRLDRVLRLLGRYLAPIVGVGVFFLVSRNLRVTYIGSSEE